MQFKGAIARRNLTTAQRREEAKDSDTKGGEFGIRFMDVNAILWQSEGASLQVEEVPIKKSLFSFLKSSLKHKGTGLPLIGHHEWPFALRFPTKTRGGVINYFKTAQEWDLPPTFALKGHALIINYEILLEFLGRELSKRDIW